MKICTKCGSQNKDTNNFCSSCGQKLESAVIRPQIQPANSSSEYWITFKRPGDIQWAMNLFHIKIDDFAKYELKNKNEVKIPMSPGLHSVEFSVFSMPKKTQFNFQVTGDMVFICKPNPLAVLSILAAPVKVYDVYGNEY